tara:strand:- start:2091 stop:3110 length:1020 start_codon:yes stop_codon:yes gene_type:complete
MLNSNSKVLITGGTGSFGKAFLFELMKKHPNIERVVIFSRDELKQWELQNLYPKSKYPQLRFFIGDIRDRDRLNRATENIDTIVHAAALKQVTAAEYNPMEFIKTNILGTENIIHASIKNNIKKIVALSTDKAAAPINVYGATKLVSDKLLIAGNNIRGNRNLSFSIVRYGNVMGSRGSVIPFFIKNAKSGFLPITHPMMTRFNITLNQAIDMVFWVLNNSLGGEIFVPKIPSYSILDLAEAIGPNCEKKIIGIRDGEKIDEEMITYADSFNTYDIGNYYAIIQPSSEIKFDNYKNYYENMKNVDKGFSYNSGNNKEFLNINELRRLIKDNVDLNFKPI